MLITPYRNLQKY